MRRIKQETLVKLLLSEGNQFNALDISRLGPFDKQNYKEEILFSDCRAQHTNFSKMNLHNVNFVNCDLGGAIFHDTNLRGAEFSDCNLNAASFTDANICGTHFFRCSVYTTDFNLAIFNDQTRWCAPTVMLQAWWDLEGDNNLIIEAMRFDAQNHGDIEKFDIWVNEIWECPYFNNQYERAVNFEENTDLWKRAKKRKKPVLTPLELFEKLRNYCLWWEE